MIFARAHQEQTSLRQLGSRLAAFIESRPFENPLIENPQEAQGPRRRNLLGAVIVAAVGLAIACGVWIVVGSGRWPLPGHSTCISSSTDDWKPRTSCGEYNCCMSFVTRYLEPNLVERLNHLQLSARSVVEGSITGQHRSPVKGASVEFRQHRFYTPGDELRHLDWRVLARTDRPYIKEYDEETNLRCLLMLDCSGSMAYGRACERSKVRLRREAGRVARLPDARTVRKCRSCPLLIARRAMARSARRRRRSSPASSRRWSARLPAAKHAWNWRCSRPPTGWEAIAGDCCLRLLCAVPTLRQGLARLRHDRHETIVLQVLDPDEVQFPFRTWSRFRGLEGERPQLCEPAVVRKMYLDNFRRHRREMEDTCRALGVEFYSFVTEKPLIESITTFLHRRQR